MPYQNIDASLSAADMKAVKDAFNTILRKLPFLVSLTPQERKSMFKAVGWVEERNPAFRLSHGSIQL